MARAYDYFYKLVIVGDRGVGKTGILCRFSEDAFDSTFISRTGGGKARTIQLDGKNIELQIWDSLSPSGAYRGAKGIMLVYDISDLVSFANISCWLKDVERLAATDAERMILGNKCDLEMTREVGRKEGEMLAAEHGIRFMETSAKTGQGVEFAFLTLARDIMRKMRDRTALHFAVETKSHYAAKSLMATEADINSMDRDGRTALIIAAEKGDLTSIQMLLQASADTTVRDERGLTALQIALFETKSHSAAKVLMANKAALNSVDGDGRTALVMAVKKGDLNVLEMLLQAGADTTLRDKDGKTALMIAVEKVDSASIQMLLKAGADTTLRYRDDQDISRILYRQRETTLLDGRGPNLEATS